MDLWIYGLLAHRPMQHIGSCDMGGGGAIVRDTGLGHMYDHG